MSEHDEGKLGGVVGTERADAEDITGVMTRLRAFTDAARDAEGRKVARDDGCMVNRTYELPAPSPEVQRHLDEIERLRTRLAEPLFPSGQPVDATPVRTTHHVAGYRENGAGTEGRDGEPSPAPSEQGTLVGIAGDNGRTMTITDDAPRLDPHDPVEIAERGPDAWRGICRLCPSGTEGAAVDTTSPGAVRAELAKHMRENHRRSSWPGAQ